MTKTSGAATADSAANRNIAQDQAYVGHARGELALAEGRPADAVTILEAARVGGAFDPQIVDALAAAQLAVGNLNAAAKSYEEVIANRPFGLEAQENWMWAHVRLGEVYQRLGRLDAAREQIRAAGRTVEGRGLRSRGITGSQSASFALKWVIPQPPEREPGHLRFGEANTLGTLGDASRSWRKAVAQASEDW